MIRSRTDVALNKSVFSQVKVNISLDNVGDLRPTLSAMMRLRGDEGVMGVPTVSLNG